MNIDQSQNNFDLIFAQLSQQDLSLETEQDARLQIIDRILIEVLGWERENISTEPHTESGFIDYLLNSQGQNRFVVEAKRTSKLLIDTRLPKMSWYKANGAAIKSASNGLKQAQKYCVNTGVLFSALTTGLEWIGFWAIRSGFSPFEGKAVVFPSLQSIQDDFATFYDLFSKEGILANLYQAHIHEQEGLQISHNEILESVLIDSDRRLLSRSSLSAG